MWIDNASTTKKTKKVGLTPLERRVGHLSGMMNFDRDACMELNETGVSMFITGDPGSGKTTLAAKLITCVDHDVVMVPLAMTHVAALNLAECYEIASETASEGLDG